PGAQGALLGPPPGRPAGRGRRRHAGRPEPRGAARPARHAGGVGGDGAPLPAGGRAGRRGRRRAGGAGPALAEADRRRGPGGLGGAHPPGGGRARGPAHRGAGRGGLGAGHRAGLRRAGRPGGAGRRLRRPLPRRPAGAAVPAHRRPHPVRGPEDPGVPTPMSETTERTFTLPDLGEGLVEATVLEWLVAPGDRIERNAPLVELETTKSAVEVPSPYSGTVLRLHAEADEVVQVGAALVTFEVVQEAGIVGTVPKEEKAARRRVRLRPPEA